MTLRTPTQMSLPSVVAEVLEHSITITYLESVANNKSSFDSHKNTRIECPCIHSLI